MKRVKESFTWQARDFRREVGDAGEGEAIVDTLPSGAAEATIQARARQRPMRFTEELTEEMREMRRVKEAFTWQARVDLLVKPTASSKKKIFKACILCQTMLQV